MNNANRISRKRNAITVDRVFSGTFQKAGTVTVQLRQVIDTTAYYLSTRLNNSMTENIFSQNELGAEEKAYSSKEERVAFINIPAKFDQAEVEKRLAEAGEKAVIYKILSSKPILTSEQKSAINSGITTLDKIANSQVARYGEGSDRAGELVFDQNGKVQYRSLFFSNEGKADSDLRTSDPSDTYMTPEIEQEVSGGFTITTHDANLSRVEHQIENSVMGQQEV